MGFQIHKYREVYTLLKQLADEDLKISKDSIAGVGLFVNFDKYNKLKEEIQKKLNELHVKVQTQKNSSEKMKHMLKLKYLNKALEIINISYSIFDSKFIISLDELQTEKERIKQEIGKIPETIVRTELLIKYIIQYKKDLYSEYQTMISIKQIVQNKKLLMNTVTKLENLKKKLDVFPLEQLKQSLLENIEYLINVGKKHSNQIASNNVITSEVVNNFVNSSKSLELSVNELIQSMNTIDTESDPVPVSASPPSSSGITYANMSGRRPPASTGPTGAGGSTITTSSAKGGAHSSKTKKSRGTHGKRRKTTHTKRH